MTVLLLLIPIALVLGAVGLVAFIWTLRSGQFDDLDGAAARILDDGDDRPIADRPIADRSTGKPIDREADRPARSQG